jgi:hypothetical protein
MYAIDTNFGYAIDPDYIDDLDDIAAEVLQLWRETPVINNDKYRRAYDRLLEAKALLTKET